MRSFQKSHFHFFAEFWVRVTSGSPGSVSVGFGGGGASIEPVLGGGSAPRSRKARRPCLVAHPMALCTFVGCGAPPRGGGVPPPRRTASTALRHTVPPPNPQPCLTPPPLQNPQPCVTPPPLQTHTQPCVTPPPSKPTKVEQLRVIYDLLSEVSLVNDVLRISGIDAPLIASLTSSLGSVVSSFERLRMFSDYRTPSSIRAFIHLCIVLVPLLLIPVFAQLALLHHSYVVYCASFLLPLPFMLLSNVQKGLENPFSKVQWLGRSGFQFWGVWICTVPQNRGGQAMDGLWTEVCGQQKQSNNPSTTSTSSIRQLLGAADAQTAHHSTFSTAPAHQPLGSANAETTPARAPAAAADRKQRPDATCEGKNG